MEFPKEEEWSLSDAFILNCRTKTKNPTKTTQDQKETEAECASMFVPLSELTSAQQNEFIDIGLFREDGSIRLMREKHIGYLLRSLAGLRSRFSSLDPSRPWLCYWIFHSLNLLEALPEDCDLYLDFIRRCQARSGGFAGGPQQATHIAPCYASTMALASIGSDDAYRLIDRPGLYRFLMSMKQPCGGFTMQQSGEVDVRGSYTAVACATMTNILTPKLVENVADFVAKCQTHEGGFGGEPGAEAHGGYTFCGLATLALLRRLDKCDVDAALKWLCSRQMALEGGFNGRSNKLVDGCYSFWQGASFRVLSEYSSGGGGGRFLMNQEALQRYILACCQYMTGGLLDKPSKSADQYHTCYCLSGLSVAQHGPPLKVMGTESNVEDAGDAENLLPELNVLYNVRKDKADRALAFFQRNFPQPDHESLLAEFVESVGKKCCHGEEIGLVMGSAVVICSPTLEYAFHEPDRARLIEVPDPD